jgi:hypothetical protein
MSPCPVRWPLARLLMDANASPMDTSFSQETTCILKIFWLPLWEGLVGGALQRALLGSR